MAESAETFEIVGHGDDNGELTKEETDETNIKDVGNLLKAEVVVDERIFDYMKNSSKYGQNIKEIEFNFEVQSEFVKPDCLKLVGKDEKKLEEAREEAEKLVKHCAKKVHTESIPANEELFRQISEYADGIHNQDEGCMIRCSDSVIYLTGTDKETQRTKGVLEEMYGLETSNINKDQILPETEKVLDSSLSTPPTEKSEMEDEVNEELYGGELEEVCLMEGNGQLVVDADVWRYVEKSSFIASVNDIKKEMDVEFGSESALDDGSNRLRLSFRGNSEDQVGSAMVRIRGVILQCRSETKTLKVPCPDAAVFTKISKLAKAINKAPCYVAAADQTIHVTGNDADVAKCLERLSTYGLKYEEEKKKEEIQNIQYPVEAMVPPENGSRNGNLLEDTRPPTNYVGPQIVRSPSTGVVTRDLPVPIEEFLWLYLKKVHYSKLNELKDSFRATISTAPSSINGSLTMKVTAETEDMLECAQDAFCNMLQDLGGQIIVTMLDTQSQQELPPELMDLLQRQCAGEGTIIEVQAGGRICIIGPSKEAQQTQQRVVAFLQEMAKQVQNLSDNPEALANMQRLMGQGGGGIMGTGGLDTLGMGRGGDGLGRGSGLPMGAVGGGPGGNIYGARPGIRPGETTNFGDFGESKQGSRSGFEVTEDSSRKNKVTSSTTPTFDDTDDDDDMALNKMAHPSQMVKPTNPSSNSKQPKPSSSKDSLDSERSRRVRFSDDDAAKAENGENRCGDGCSVCQTERKKQSKSNCEHNFCVEHIQMYFGDGEPHCPICGNSENERKFAVSQPEDGKILINYDSSFRLPGFEDQSRGTIIVIYAFPSGCQKVILSVSYIHSTTNVLLLLLT